MGNKKLLCQPTMFQPWLNQTQIDLSKRKIQLISRETELLKEIRSLKYELKSVQSSISGLDSQNDFAAACHNLNLLRRV